MKAVSTSLLALLCLAGSLAAQTPPKAPLITEARLLAWADSITKAPLKGGSGYISYRMPWSMVSVYSPLTHISTRPDTFDNRLRIRYRLRYIGELRVEQWRGIGYHILYHDGEPTYIRVKDPGRLLGIEPEVIRVEAATRITWLDNGYMTVKRPFLKLEQVLPSLPARQ